MEEAGRPMSATMAAKRFGALLRRVVRGRGVVIIHRYNKPAVAIIPARETVRIERPAAGKQMTDGDA